MRPRGRAGQLPVLFRLDQTRWRLTTGLGSRKPVEIMEARDALKVFLTSGLPRLATQDEQWSLLAKRFSDEARTDYSHDIVRQFPSSGATT